MNNLRLLNKKTDKATKQLKSNNKFQVNKKNNKIAKQFKSKQT